MSKIILGVLLIAISAISCKSNLSCKELKTDYFTITGELHTGKDTSAFITELNELIEKDPSCEKALQARAYFLLTRDSVKLAKRDFINALKLNNHSVYTLYGIASIYNLDLRNDSAYYFINLAIEAKSRGGYALDQNDFFSNKFDIPIRELVFFRGLILYEGGLFDKAKSDFIKSLKLEHEGGEAFAYLASIYLKQGRLDSACFYDLEARKLGFRTVIDSAIVSKCQ